MNNGLTIDNAMICPHCGGEDCYSYSTDEIEFSYDNTGHYHVDCHCNECGRGFRLYMKFKYEVTEHYSR